MSTILAWWLATLTNINRVPRPSYHDLWDALESPDVPTAVAEALRDYTALQAEWVDKGEPINAGLLADNARVRVTNALIDWLLERDT